MPTKSKINMSILNYTTTIDAGKTVGELQGILAKAGCRKILIDFNEIGEPDAVTFMVAVNEQPLYFTLPCNVAGVLKAMQKDRNIAGKYRTEAQARRVAWRIIKDWCQAQLAIIEAGQAQLAEVFLPYAQHQGTTLFKSLEAGNLKLLN
ncbi:hypothetical protein [uncultured Hymenobacter sp.]|uniref:hypothetical protein n=1 Tax=uncultured Hymenobacter sp. TaxID=170016 RepID=UPI0035CB9BD6